MKQKLPSETPVYLFLGFLESGKTKFIQETLQDPRFSTGEKTLLLVTEEGELEYEPENGTGQQCDGNPQRGKKLFQGGEMLLRQNLRGRHQGRLPAVSGSAESGGCRHHGLAAAHIPLYQTVHGSSPAEKRGSSNVSCINFVLPDSKNPKKRYTGVSVGNFCFIFFFP